MLYRLGQTPEVAAALVDLTQAATNSMMDAVLAESDPVPLLTFFAENPDEFSRISRLEPRFALVALGKFTARLEGASPGSTSPARPTSSAPAPIRPVVGTRSVGAPASKRLAELDHRNEDEFVEYVRRSTEEDRKRGRL